MLRFILFFVDFHFSKNLIFSHLITFIFEKFKEFHTQYDDALNQRNNYTVEYETDKYGLIKLFISLNEKIFVIIQEMKELKENLNAKTGFMDVNLALNKFSMFYKKIKITEKFTLVESSCITNKCILLNLKDETYLTPLVELSEID